MARGKNIRVYLKNGTADGIIKCSLANWSVVVYKIPRIYLNDCRGKEDYEKSGVYFLFGKDADERDVVYIGKASKRKNDLALINRIGERHDSINEWTECILVTTETDRFGATEIGYLENIFTKSAISANRYEVANGNEPPLGNITEETESEVLDFFDNAKLILGFLGHKVLEPIVRKNDNENLENSSHTETSLFDNTPVYYINGRNYKAKGKQVNDGFVVLAGSTVSLNIVDSCPESAIKNRKKFANRFTGNKIITDILFSSPSNAAGFVCGYSVNGLDRWQTQDGKKLADML